MTEYQKKKAQRLAALYRENMEIVVNRLNLPAVTAAEEYAFQEGFRAGLDHAKVLQTALEDMKVAFNHRELIHKICLAALNSYEKGDE